MNALGGYALAVGRELAGYCYYVIEESKGLIGDLYVRPRFRSVQSENLLLEASLERLTSLARVKRVEAQLMLLASPFARAIPRPDALRIHERNFMAVDLTGRPQLDPGPASDKIRIVEWSRGVEDDAARLIAAAYAGHVDGDINDQYRSAAGARRFLLNIVQYPGCGRFLPASSLLALEERTGDLCGLCLSSLVAPDVGHITQICTAPETRGRGVGYELLRHCLGRLRRHGCRKASLTVTASNDTAVHLYFRAGFHVERNFAAYVWEGI
jgi:ribosomal protein S18 acetylase RimI-like enzyme